MQIDYRRRLALSVVGTGLATASAGCFLPMDASDLRVRNDDSRNHEVRLSVTHENGTKTLDESIPLWPGENATRYSVFEEKGTYTIAASLEDGTTNSATVDIDNPRRDPMYHVTVKERTTDGDESDGSRITMGEVAP